MNRRLIIFFIALINIVACSNPIEEQVGNIDFDTMVNPFIGASTSPDTAGVYHGLGKTFPGAATPFGMVQVSPNTITGGDNGSGYSYEHTSIEGFALTQMSGIGWNGDMGNFLVIPATGPLKTSVGSAEDPDVGYRSRYSKNTEHASAGYYTVRLDDYRVQVEMGPEPNYQWGIRK